MSAPPSREVLLETRLSELVEYRLELTCSCGFQAQYSLKSMAEQRIGGYQLKTLISRLRCKKCDGPPQSVAVLDATESESGTQRPGWRVVVAGLS